MRAAKLAAATAVAVLGLALPAFALPQLPLVPRPVAGNPADRLARLPIEPFAYDRATHCSRARRPGVERAVAWLRRNVAGAAWGTYRCERWGKGAASLHAEGRAIDWHLDARDPAQRRAGEALVRLLLAPDRLGNPQALARRMGVEELIWDCGYWGAGMAAFRPYRACVNAHGTPRKRVDPTLAHLDHLHIGFTKAGAMARTSFWSAR